jgi:hypothetical protein
MMTMGGVQTKGSREDLLVLPVTPTNDDDASSVANSLRVTKRPFLKRNLSYIILAKDNRKRGIREDLFYHFHLVESKPSNTVRSELRQDYCCPLCKFKAVSSLGNSSNFIYTTSFLTYCQLNVHGVWAHLSAFHGEEFELSNSQTDDKMVRLFIYSFLSLP